MTETKPTTERPILFSAPMVLALLGGTKTQTRRIVKPQDSIEFDPQLDDPIYRHSATCPGYCDYGCGELLCPYGKPGDRLWVKETWRPVLKTRAVERIRYEADGALQIKVRGRGWKRPKAAKAGNVSPLFMPRWASRITLEVTGVRVERLNNITPSDAWAEGVRCECTKPTPMCAGNAEAFRSLWESINGAGSWKANSWVWVVEFRKVTP